MIRSAGLLMLLVVVVVVLLLAARSWNGVAPTALDVQGHGATTVVDDHGEAEAGRQARSGSLPGLSEMQEETDERAQQVQDALAATH